ncbi:hypothetical protein O982_24760 [Mycobacterium avium 10-5581]|nr:hypothetical protein O982_24760 [Mycobacterium avium 10-5581]
MLPNHAVIRSPDDGEILGPGDAVLAWLGHPITP